MVYENESISLNNVNKVFIANNTQVTALQDINLAIGDGEFFCIVGPSGCGKTTLLRILAGLDDASSGQISIKSIDSDKPINSMVFQEQSILPWMKIREKQSRQKKEKPGN